jgi:UDP-2-acetamido-3-amino-2,3-dideoxy-glucuronate N-acetyltransferase
VTPAPDLVPSDRGPGLWVAPGTEIPEDVSIAPHVTIYAGVRLGAGVLLEQGAMLGRPQRIDPRSRTPVSEPGAATTLGEGCQVGSNSVVVAGAHVGARTKLSDNVLIREGAFVGEEAMIGRGSLVSGDSRVLDRARLMSEVIVGPGTVIEEDVLVGPRVTFVGDPTMGRRHSRSAGTVVRRASRIGTAAILVPPLEIGEEAVIAAAAMVRQDVPGRTVVAGAPARTLRAVRDDELLEVWSKPA